MITCAYDLAPSVLWHYFCCAQQQKHAEQSFTDCCMREKHSKYQEHFHIISRVSRIDTVYCCGLISFLLFDLLILNLFIKGYKLFLLTFVIILYFECKVMRDITNAMVLELYKKYFRKCFRKNMQGTTFAEGCSIYVQVVLQYWSVYICRSKYYIC